MEPHKESNDPNEQLKKFRATHSYKQRKVAGAHWEYILCGCCEEALLLLPGAPGLGEVAFQLIMKFEQAYCVLSPSYPSSITTVAGLVDGLADILAVEHIAQVTVVGGSYSGMIAQEFVRRYSARVKKLVLDHAGMPRSDRVRTYKFYRTILSFLPLACLRATLKLGKSLSLRSMPTHRVFWSGYFDEMIATLKQKDYLSRIQVCIDFDRNYRFSCDDLLHWHGSILIIESDNDSYVPPEERKALKALYPRAQVHTFHNTSHFAWATESEVFLQVIEHFVEETT